MRLQYRGVSYEQNHSAEASGATEGKFRGRKWTNKHYKAADKPSGLVYRGVAVK